MICWVHGANSSDQSFNYLRSRLPDEPRLVFEYETRTPLSENIATLEGILESSAVTGIVGHSLGGVMAAIMVKRGFVERGVTIASPLGGFHFANYLPFTQLLLDIGSMRPIYRELLEWDFSDTLLTIIASKKGKSSDGVVPLSSQTAVKTNLTEHVNLNHFEVLLNEDVAMLIQRHLIEKGAH